ncbi:hypothetical protein NCC49_004798 [Naganishia albida]|nr:hypothetical protein NCC49_004798 [Naganishia albida]
MDEYLAIASDDDSPDEVTTVDCPGCGVPVEAERIDKHKRGCINYKAKGLAEFQVSEDEDDVEANDIQRQLSEIINTGKKKTQIKAEPSWPFGRTQGPYREAVSTRAEEPEYEVVKVVTHNRDDIFYGCGGSRTNPSANRKQLGRSQLSKMDIESGIQEKAKLERRLSVREFTDVTDAFFTGRLSLAPPSTNSNVTRVSIPSLVFSADTFGSSGSAFGDLAENEPGKTNYDLTEADIQALQEADEQDVRNAIEASGMERLTVNKDREAVREDKEAEASGGDSPLGSDLTPLSPAESMSGLEVEGGKRKREGEDVGRVGVDEAPGRGDDVIDDGQSSFRRSSVTLPGMLT